MHPSHPNRTKSYPVTTLPHQPNTMRFLSLLSNGRIDLNDEINDIVKKKDEYTGQKEKLQNSLDPNDSEAINSIVESYLRR